MQDHICTKAGTVFCLVVIMLVHQVSSGPVPRPDDRPGILQNTGLLKRTARMTPLWRIMGSKPLRAYCQDNYECSTRICKNGRCSFNQPVTS